jgi:Spy/CpxP family protein refolding chaperone
MRRTIVGLLVLLVAAAASPAAAQPRGGEPGFGGGFPRPLFLEHLYRPELIMRYQGELALTAEQRTAIAGAIKDAQGRLAPLQWDLEAKSESVAKLVDADKVDVDAVLAAATQAVDLEGQIKKEHLRLLLTIKNQLTPAQQTKLRDLRPDRCPPDRPGAPGDRGRRMMPPPPPDDDGGPPMP